jgi:uncharacterized SAM-binding protein YcdF (DUF218 family)
MTSTPAQPGLRHWIVRILGVIVLLAAAAIALTAWRVQRQAANVHLHPADAIVVFGAAEYSGKPSPVYRARLDHAFHLYEQEYAPVIITTGGGAADPSYTEGGVGHDYLVRLGLPETAIIAETQASDTAQSAERVAVIMRANGIRNCIAVSDEYHMFRVVKMLERQGVEVYAAPRPDSRPRSRWSRLEIIVREAVSYLWWWAKSATSF